MHTFSATTTKTGQFSKYHPFQTKRWSSCVGVQTTIRIQTQFLSWKDSDGFKLPIDIELQIWIMARPRVVRASVNNNDNKKQTQDYWDYFCHSVHPVDDWCTRRKWKRVNFTFISSGRKIFPFPFSFSFSRLNDAFAPFLYGTTLHFWRKKRDLWLLHRLHRQLLPPTPYYQITFNPSATVFLFFIFYFFCLDHTHTWSPKGHWGKNARKIQICNICVPKLFQFIKSNNLFFPVFH